MQAQMTPATAPGIAGLMQGKPQSPTAGLGNVPQRIGAYGEQGLAQKNAVTQDLLDLMAAQKLKAEKEAAARQMQLQAAQQGQPLTVAQSLDKELLDMTKQELAPQQAPQQAAPGVAGASQQQAGNQKAAMDRLMAMASQGGPQGISRAPGADQVMPQRMAGGGIVAFEGGGLTTGYAPDYTDARRLGIDLSPYDSPKVRAEKLERLRKMREFEKYMAENRAEIPREEPPVQPDTMQAEEQRLLGRFPAPQMPEPPQAPQQPPMRMPPAQVQSKVPVQGAPAALEKPAIGNITPGGVVPRPPETSPMQPPAAAQPAQPAIDPEARRAEAMERFNKAMARTPEEEQFYKEQLERARAGMAAEDPRNKMWYERLADLMPYLSQQRIQPGQQGIIGGLGRIGAAGAQLQGDERTRREKQQAAIDAMQGGRMKELRGLREKGLTFSTEEDRLGRQEQLKGRELDISQAGVAERGRATDVQATTARLERESREAMAKMDDKTRRYLGDLQARTRQGGQLNPDDFARIRTNATKAVEDRLKADGNWLILQRKDPVAAERQKQEAIEKLSQDLVRFARSGGATAAPPTGGVPDQKVIDFASIGAK